MSKTIQLRYSPRPQQRAIHEAMWKHRFGVIVCHRRMGKTVAAVNHLIRAAMTCEKEAPRFAYLAPTYRQGKAVAWDYFCRFSEQVAGRTVNQSELRIDFAQNEAQIRIFGADSPDSLRGLYFDGIVPDEYGLMPLNIYSEVLGPTLVDRGGWALFMGTPNGRNQFYEAWRDAENRPDWFRLMFKASETGIIAAEELARAREEMTEDEFSQEYECSFSAAVRGAIFGKEMTQVVEDGRICRVPYEPALPVDTTWDLGVNDPTAIWFSQSTRGGEIRLIDYEEHEGESLPFFSGLLRQKPYIYGRHWAPHDIQVRELSSGRSRWEAASRSTAARAPTARARRSRSTGASPPRHAGASPRSPTRAARPPRSSPTRRVPTWCSSSSRPRARTARPTS